MKQTGQAFKFGDNLSTDLIISGRYKFSIREMKELAKHVMEDADSRFYQKIQGKLDDRSINLLLYDRQMREVLLKASMTDDPGLITAANLVSLAESA